MNIGYNRKINVKSCFCSRFRCKNTFSKEKDELEQRCESVLKKCLSTIFNESGNKIVNSIKYCGRRQNKEYFGLLSSLFYERFSTRSSENWKYSEQVRKLNIQYPIQINKFCRWELSTEDDLDELLRKRKINDNVEIKSVIQFLWLILDTNKTKENIIQKILILFRNIKDCIRRVSNNKKIGHKSMRLESKKVNDPRNVKIERRTRKSRSFNPNTTERISPNYNTLKAYASFLKKETKLDLKIKKKEENYLSERNREKFVFLNLEVKMRKKHNYITNCYVEHLELLRKFEWSRKRAYGMPPSWACYPKYTISSLKEVFMDKFGKYDIEDIVTLTSRRKLIGFNIDSSNKAIYDHFKLPIFNVFSNFHVCKPDICYDGFVDRDLNKKDLEPVDVEDTSDSQDGSNINEKEMDIMSYKDNFFVEDGYLSNDENLCKQNDNFSIGIADKNKSSYRKNFTDSDIFSSSLFKLRNKVLKRIEQAKKENTLVIMTNLETISSFKASYRLLPFHFVVEQDQLTVKPPQKIGDLSEET